MSSGKKAQFVTIIGGANIDIHGKSTGPLRANDSNPGTVHVSAGGVARNVAENLARLGIDSRLITAVGDDHNGRTVLRLSREAGTNVQYVHKSSSLPTSTYLSVIDSSGDMKIAINDMSVIDRLTRERVQQHEDMLHQSSLIVLDTNLPEDTLDWLADEFARIPIFVDTVSAAKAPRISHRLGSIHTLKTSAIEAEALTGVEAKTEPQLTEVAAKLHTAGVERVFVTLGSDGVFYSTPEAQGILKPERRDLDVRNAGGAGDAFLAGLACARLDDRGLADTLRFALTVADLTLSDMATSSPTLSLAAVKKAMEARNAG